MIDIAEVIKQKNHHHWLVLFGDSKKNPAICGPWRKITSQNNEELNDLFNKTKGNARNWGPICGHNDLFSFDFDWPFIFRHWVKEFKERAQTLTYETPNGGARGFYYTTEKPRGDPFKNNIHLEFKGNHYVAVGGEALTIESEFKPYRISLNHPIRRDDSIIKDTTTFFNDLLSGRYRFLHYKCIDDHLKRCGKRIFLTHNQGLIINSFMISNGCKDWEIHNLRQDVYDYKDMHYLPEYDEGITQGQIRSTRKYIESGGLPWPCYPSNNNDGLAKTFNFDTGNCKGCSRRKNNANEVKPSTFFTIKPNGKIGRFIPKKMGDIILTKHRFAATSQNSNLWAYKPSKGIWEPDGVETVQQIATEWLGSLFKPIYATDTEKYIRFTNYIDSGKLGGPAQKVVMVNGVYDLQTDEIEPFDPDLYAISKIPVSYNPNAKCPNILRFLEEVVGPKDIQILIEFLGYCLLKEFPIARILLLVGEGYNGKSTYLLLVVRFLGPENVSSVSLQKIAEGGFRSAELHGKLANVAGDIPARPIKDTGAIKMLTGRDLITAEKKFRDPFKYYNHAKPVFSANQIPATYDDTIAYHRRIVIVPFPNSFPREDPKTDIHIIDKLTTPEELSGLFNLAVKGLKRFLAQGGFSNEPSAQVRKIEYIRRSNQVQYFAIQFVERSPDNWISKAHLYDHYVHLCQKLQVTPVANNWFSRNVRRYLPYVYEGDERIDNQKVKVWRGIRVRLDALEAEAGTAGTVGTASGIVLKNTLDELFNVDSKNKENTSPTVPIVPELIKAIEAEGQVGAFWPRVWLEDHGVNRSQADEIIKGLRSAGKLIQKPSLEWEVP